MFIMRYKMNIEPFNKLDIVLVCGLQGSGKTHFAKHYFKQTNRKRINRGELRKALYTMTQFGDEWSPNYFNEIDETLVKHTERKIIEHFLQNRRKILIDNTSVTKESRKNYIQLAKQMKKSLGVIYLNIPLEKCLERNKLNEDHVPEQIIANLFAKIQLPSADEELDEFLIINDY